MVAVLLLLLLTMMMLMFPLTTLGTKAKKTASVFASFRRKERARGRERGGDPIEKTRDELGLALNQQAN